MIPISPVILTHRGLEPEKENFFSESSYESFADQLQRGFGIEFDPNFIQDGHIIIAHDTSLTRITGGADNRLFTEVLPEEVHSFTMARGRLCFFEELMDLIAQSSSPVHAMHLKGIHQTQEELDTLLFHLEQYPELLQRLIIFDVKPEIAAYLKTSISDLVLAPSVAHTYDIERYNNAVSETLISINDALKYKNLYDWVWLDEWDLADRGGSSKKFYTESTFELLKSVGYKISLVTPELHATSPGLLGGESHPDAKNQTTLMKRIQEIISLQPDALCTDYPEKVRQLL